MRFRFSACETVRRRMVRENQPHAVPRLPGAVHRHPVGAQLVFVEEYTGEIAEVLMDDVLALALRG
jgi:hypothetical protein